MDANKIHREKALWELHKNAKIYIYIYIYIERDWERERERERERIPVDFSMRHGIALLRLDCHSSHLIHSYKTNSFHRLDSLQQPNSLTKFLSKLNGAELCRLVLCIFLTVGFSKWFVQKTNATKHICNLTYAIRRNYPKIYYKKGGGGVKEERLLERNRIEEEKIKRKAQREREREIW